MMISLKRATISDVKALVALEQGVAGTHIYVPMLKEEEWIEEIGKSVVYLIEKDGVVVGNVSYEKINKDNVYISGLVVNPKFQGQGIAHEALLKILEELKDIKRIDLVTHPDNTKALKLYESLGFTVESRKENYFGDGEPRLVLVLQK